MVDIGDVAGGSTLAAVVIGTPPIPETASYAAALEQTGIDPGNVVVQFIPQTDVNLGDPLLPD
jgi:hypothetical protein